MNLHPIWTGVALAACLALVVVLPLNAQISLGATGAPPPPANSASTNATPATSFSPVPPPGSRGVGGDGTSPNDTDTATRHLTAVQRDLHSSVNALQRANATAFGGFVEKALAHISQALQDTAAGLQYLQAHPEIDPVAAWTADDSMKGLMPRPLIPLPIGQYVRNGGAPSTVDSNLFSAYQVLMNADDDFMRGFPGKHPYEVGDIGGFTIKIRADILDAAADLDNAALIAASPTSPASPDGELVVNGGFENPPTPTTGRPAALLVLPFTDSQNIKKYGWRAISGSTFTPLVGQVIHEGHVANIFGGGSITYGATAFEGQQWFFLAGSTGFTVEQWTQGNAIEQILPTTPGKVYVLTFACANTPFPIVNPMTGAVEKLSPSNVVVTLKDALSDDDLIKPATFTHNTSTPTDYHWTSEGPIQFTAKSAHTILQFQIGDYMTPSDGIFLDAISIKPAPAKILDRPDHN